MFHKIEIYLDITAPECGDQLALDIACDMAHDHRVLDHLVVNGKCTAKEARSAGLHLPTRKGTPQKKKVE